MTLSAKPTLRSDSSIRRTVDWTDINSLAKKSVGRFSLNDRLGTLCSNRTASVGITHMWESAQSVLTNQDFSYVHSEKLIAVKVDVGTNKKFKSIVDKFFFSSEPNQYPVIRSTWINGIQDNILTVRDHEIQDYKSQRLANGFMVRCGIHNNSSTDVFTNIVRRANAFSFKDSRGNSSKTNRVALLITKNFTNTVTTSVPAKPIAVFRKKYLQQPVLMRDYIHANATKSEYPILGMLKRTVELPFFYAIKDSYGYAKSIKQKNFQEYNQLQTLHEQYDRHPLTQSKYIRKHLLSTTAYSRFTRFNIVNNVTTSVAAFFKTIWRYFKFKIEAFFFKKLGVRVHMWMMNIWDIFLAGIDSYWQWFKFEDQKLFSLTRKGQRFFLETRDDAKFYLRAMVLTLTFGGGVKLYIDKITQMIRQYRNNWAFVTNSMENLRLCGNFFWFRFFLNYKVTFQGKIAGILRAEKKLFKKGEVTIEDRKAVVVYHRTFPQSRFGSYCLSFWLQYRVPNLIGTFNEMEYIDTMKVLLNMYSVPWLASRLAEIIRELRVQKEVKDVIRLEQYERRKRFRGILAKELVHYRTELKKKKNLAKA